MAGGKIEFTAQSFETLREDIKMRALEKAVMDKVVSDEEDAVVRDLLPTDLGATEDKFEQTLNTAGAYNVIYNTDLNEKKIVVIYGAVIPNGTIGTTLKFNLGNAKVIDIVQLEKAKYMQNPILLLDNPIVYGKSANIKIEEYVPTGTTVPAKDNIVLLGIVVEPKGTTISPDEQ